MKRWPTKTRLTTTLSLLFLASLAGCGDSGGNSNKAGRGDIADLPPPPPPDVDPGDITNTPLPLLEDFGNFTAFDQSDTVFFFSPDYEALATDNPDDPRPAFYYPTCCFFDGNDPNGDITVDHENRLGIVNDNGNSTLLVSDARFSVAQTASSLAASGTDPKKDSTPGVDDGSGWGELDLTQPYKISFCVKAASGSSSSSTQIYVDNNTTSEANSIHGGGSTGSRIFNIPTASLISGARVEINVPGNITLEPGGAVAAVRPELVGTSQSFLQFRVSSGGSAIFDDLLVEYQDEVGATPLPDCTPFTPATPPAAMAAPNVTAQDAAIAVSWSDVLGALSYDVAYNTVDSPEPAQGAELVVGITDTQTILDNLTNGTEYFVFVRAVNSAGAGDWSPAATATPEEPVGCAPIQQVQPSPVNAILWNVYDGCLAPADFGSVVVDGSTVTNFEMDPAETPFFTSNQDGTATLDTTSDGGLRSKADLSDIIAGGPDEYPKHFTLIARIDTAMDSARGLEMEVSFGDQDERRVKTILRSDSGDSGRIQLERFLDDAATTAEVDVAMNDGFHIYHIAFTMNGPADIDASVYRDGVDITDQFAPPIVDGGTGRDGGSSNRLRIGEDSSSGYFARVDWVLWSNGSGVTALTPADLVDELPDGIGELGAYSSDP
ncbi:MAG: fibronectin type III domain-containing protein [Woeseiaceae bacterium]